MGMGHTTMGAWNQYKEYQGVTFDSTKHALLHTFRFQNPRY